MLKIDFDRGELSIQANGTDLGVGFLGIDLKSGRYRVIACLYNRHQEVKLLNHQIKYEGDLSSQTSSKVPALDVNEDSSENGESTIEFNQ
jgi:hypothetical protein